MSSPRSIFVLTWRSGIETAQRIKAPEFEFGQKLFFFFSSIDVFFSFSFSLLSLL